MSFLCIPIIKNPFVFTNVADLHDILLKTLHRQMMTLRYSFLPVSGTLNIHTKHLAECYLLNSYETFNISIEYSFIHQVTTVHKLFFPFQFLHNFIVPFFVQSIEEQNNCGNNPQNSRNCGKCMFHNRNYLWILRLVCHIAVFSKQSCQKRCANCHSHFVSKRNKRILESVISKAGLPFAIFYTQFTPLFRIV